MLLLLGLDVCLDDDIHLFHNNIRNIEEAV